MTTVIMRLSLNNTIEANNNENSLNREDTSSLPDYELDEDWEQIPHGVSAQVEEEILDSSLDSPFFGNMYWPLWVENEKTENDDLDEDTLVDDEEDLDDEPELNDLYSIDELFGSHAASPFWTAFSGKKECENDWIARYGNRPRAASGWKAKTTSRTQWGKIPDRVGLRAAKRQAREQELAQADLRRQERCEAYKQAALQRMEDERENRKTVLRSLPWEACAAAK